jgi:hypothetical protein
MSEANETPAVGSMRLLGACPKCGSQWGNTTIRNDENWVVFFIKCGNCGHESKPVDLFPTIEDWNASNVGDHSPP